MALNARLWYELEQHGLTEAHFNLLLAILRLHNNGSCAWHFVRGKVQTCDVRVQIPSKSQDLGQACDVLLAQDKTE